MFRQLMNFSYQRTPLQAVGWYLTFLLIGIFIAAIAIGAIQAMNGGAALPAQFVAIPYDIVLAVALLWRRSKAMPNIFLALLAVLLSPFFGPLGGLIPLAVLTTRPTIQKSPAVISEVFE